MLLVDWKKSAFFKGEGFDAKAQGQTLDIHRNRKMLAMTFEGKSSDVIAKKLKMNPKRLTTVRSALRKKIGLGGNGRGASSYVPVLSVALKEGLSIKIEDDVAFFMRQVKPEIRTMLVQMALRGLNTKEVVALPDQPVTNQNWMQDHLNGVRAPFKEMLVDGAGLVMPEIEGIVLLNAAVTVADDSILDFVQPAPDWSLSSVEIS